MTVTRLPRVALLATGDELVQPGTPLGADQVVASNTFALAPLLRPLAREIIDLGIVPDDRRKLDEALLRAFDDGVDIIVTTGGASVGERDYVQEVLKDLGVDIRFWTLAMRPGKPLMFGTRGRTLVFGLPGNPVSAQVTAIVIVLPALRRLVRHPRPMGSRQVVPVAGGLPPNASARRHYMRGTLRPSKLGFLEAHPIRETDSSHLSSLAAADALIVQAENDPGTPAGELVEVIPLWT